LLGSTRRRRHVLGATGDSSMARKKILGGNGEMPEGNPYEERARAVKAAKLVRVVRKVMDEYESDLERAAMLDDLEQAPEDFRLRCAQLAKIKPPSEQTWLVMVDVLRTLEARS
jgi:hypothetical protein